MEKTSDTSWSVILRLLGEVSLTLPPGPVWIPQPEFCPSLQELLATHRGHDFRIWQTFRPLSLEFTKDGHSVLAERPPGPFGAALIVPTRQRVETLANLAHAWKQLAEDGVLIFACANDLGARGYLTHLREAVPGLEAESSRKCRYAILRRADLRHPEVLEQWAQAGAIRVIAETGMTSVPGIYGWDKTDRGSELLLETLPVLEGRGADMGSGHGYLAREVLRRSSTITALHLVEAEARALECARENLREQSSAQYHWWDATTEMELRDLDWVIMNPPFHEGHETSPRLGRFFLQAASKALRRGGHLYLVANKFLAYEDTLANYYSRSERVLEREGFKVIHAQR